MQWLLAATLAVVTAILAWSVTNIASRPDEMTPLTTRVNTTYDYVVGKRRVPLVAGYCTGTTVASDGNPLVFLLTVDEATNCVT